METVPIRSVGPVPRLSPRMVTLVQAVPSLGEMPVTNGGWRGRDMADRSLPRDTMRKTHQQGKKKTGFDTNNSAETKSNIKLRIKAVKDLKYLINYILFIFEIH